jgi:hypothetical protein
VAERTISALTFGCGHVGYLDLTALPAERRSARIAYLTRKGLCADCFQAARDPASAQPADTHRTPSPARAAAPQTPDRDRPQPPGAPHTDEPSRARRHNRPACTPGHAPRQGDTT